MFNAVNNILFADDAMLYTQDKHVHITHKYTYSSYLCAHAHVLGYTPGDEPFSSYLYGS